MKSNRRASRAAAIEILPTVVRLAVIEPRGEADFAVQTAAVVWRQKATSLATDEGRLELAAALRQLAHHHRLANIPVAVALSGDVCVTRVVTGLNEVVRRELAELEQRSSLYLSLGHGAKATASCIMPIDARHQRALLAVASDRILQSISDALSRAGLHVAVIEPALVSLCRLAGVLEVDKEQPAVVVRGDERGVEVGISYGGQLLLDYRPAARQAKEQAAEIIGSHWNRLQRYCDRYVRVGGGQLSSVFVSGEQGLVDMVERGLASSKLEVRPLSASAIDARWEMSSSAAAGEFAAAIGAALLGTKAGQQQLFVNLIDRRRAHGHAALGPALAKALWPAAAMLLVSLGAFGAMQYQRLQRNALDAELALLEPQRSEARLLRMRAMNDQHDIEQLTRIGEHVHSLAWNELAATISQCLPEDVWLDDMKVDGQGRLQLVGASFTEDGVFEFVRWLEQVPMLEHVALSGTRPTHLGIGPATQFDVRCDFTGKSDREARHDKS